MRILVVNQFHRRPGGTGSARLNELAQAWARKGHEVRVLASTVDHASGKVAPGYGGRWYVREHQDGGSVLRTRTMAASKAYTAGRLARDLSYCATALAAGVLARWRPDVVVGSSPPLTSVAVAAALAKFHDAPLVFDLRDLWPDYAVEFGALSGAPARLAFRLEAALYRASARVVAVTPAFLEALAAKGVPARKVALVPNGVDTAEFRPGPPDAALRRRLGWEGRFVALYAGVHGPAQALDQALRAAERLRDVPDILFVFVGDGEERPRLRQAAAERGLLNVQFLEAVGREEVPALQRAADVGLVLLRGLPTFRHVYPAKVFEVMGCGRPVVAAAEGATAQLLEKAGAGVAVPPEQPEALAAALKALRGDASARARLGANGRAFVEAHYDRGKLAEEYVRVLEEVAT